MHIYIERTDGKIAQVEVSDEAEDVWSGLERGWPQSYDLIDDDMVIPGYIAMETWGACFDLDDDKADAELRDWIMEASRRWGATHPTRAT